MSKHAKRKGASAVEFALVVPLLFMFVFAAIEFSQANMIRNLCQNAAMEGARAGIVPGGTAADCTASASELIDILGLKNAVITVEPATIATSTETVQVTVTVPLSDNALSMAKFVLGKTLSQSVTLPRESNN